VSASSESFAAVVTTSVLSSSGLWATVQVFLSRRQRNDQRRRDDLTEKKDRADIDQRELDRREMLAKAQATAQRAALDSASHRYRELDKAYEKCRSGLSELSEATSLMIDVFERLLHRMQPVPDLAETYSAQLGLSELGEARRAINDARRHLR
jgi:DNA repair exonuclease SbcCD ATPase subunit